jgi:CNT family concentrative nucleoside transporter
LLLLLLLAWMFSRNRKSINWKLVAAGLSLQIVLGLLIYKLPPVKIVFGWISVFFVKIISFADAGTAFLFGEAFMSQYGATVIIKVLPVIIFFSTISAGLHYLGILQKIVYAFAWVMSKTMRLSGAESLSAAGNVFLGQTEAPLLVRPYIAGMTRSEIMCLMTGGMATIAGSVFATYVAFLGGESPEMQSQYAMFLLTASVMNAPAAIVFSKMLLPETHYEILQEELRFGSEKQGKNLIDALAGGAAAGLKLALNVAAMLLAFIALIFMINFFLKDVLGEITGLNAHIVEATNGVFDGLSLEYLLGNVFRLVAFAIGVEWQDTLQVGSLLGKKLVVNEFVAYLDLAELNSRNALNEKSAIIASFALCGFANFSSIAIQIGGIGGMAPTRQGDVSSLGMLALLGGTLATLLTATLASALIH